MRLNTRAILAVAIFLSAIRHCPPGFSANRQDKVQKPVPAFRLTSGRSARNIPCELYMNLIFLKVRVNDATTLWLNLDTGLETSILDSKQAEALGLKLEDKSNISVPGGTIELAFANGVSIGLPGVELTNERVRTACAKVM